jgi:hypothetical protein
MAALLSDNKIQKQKQKRRCEVRRAAISISMPPDNMPYYFNPQSKLLFYGAFFLACWEGVVV